MTQANAQIAKRTRLYRKIHKWISIPLLIFFFLIGFTGLLLGWKKQVALLPKTQKGVSTESKHWLTVDSLQKIAITYAENTLQKNAEINRIDIRPKKGIAKFVFVKHYTELQLDCKTGKILSVSTRNSDFIEQLHDGSILDSIIPTGGDAFKLIYTSLLSMGLIGLSLSGFWLWYNPIRIRKQKRTSTK
jgi:hypothetical protein